MHVYMHVKCSHIQLAITKKVLFFTLVTSDINCDPLQIPVGEGSNILEIF